MATRGAARINVELAQRPGSDPAPPGRAELHAPSSPGQAALIRSPAAQQLLWAWVGSARYSGPVATAGPLRAEFLRDRRPSTAGSTTTTATPTTPLLTHRPSVSGAGWWIRGRRGR
ncbi:hypothetical protein AB0K12_40715 [Nonomuraea sp. NPDC049419]|uniref:hypothetical protein n=1 Tax=Nonomuraea sp. NPDC049419 TaxID=3155772 RepID=UPI003419430A